MSSDNLLGSFEQLVLLAVAHLGEGAYGMGVRRAVEERTGRDVNIGAVYATLNRLEAKSYLSSVEESGDGGRGGRVKRTFRLLPDGIAALRESHRASSAMWQGIDPEGLEAIARA